MQENGSVCKLTCKLSGSVCSDISILLTGSIMSKCQTESMVLFANLSQLTGLHLQWMISAQTHWKG